eukprot:scaffold3380_cov118-Isochrysis_galbana.AAC.6
MAGDRVSRGEEGATGHSGVARSLLARIPTVLRVLALLTGPMDGVHCSTSPARAAPTTTAGAAAAVPASAACSGTVGRSAIEERSVSDASPPPASRSAPPPSESAKGAPPLLALVVVAHSPRTSELCPPRHREWRAVPVSASSPRSTKSSSPSHPWNKPPPLVSSSEHPGSSPSKPAASLSARSSCLLISLSSEPATPTPPPAPLASTARFLLPSPTQGWPPTAAPAGALSAPTRLVDVPCKTRLGPVPCQPASVHLRGAAGPCARPNLVAVKASEVILKGGFRCARSTASAARAMAEAPPSGIGTDRDATSAPIGASAAQPIGLLMVRVPWCRHRTTRLVARRPRADRSADILRSISGASTRATRTSAAWSVQPRNESSTVKLCGGFCCCTGSEHRPSH